MPPPTRIAVPIMFRDISVDRQSAIAAAAMGADLIEWRMDRATPADVHGLFSDSAVRAIPWILTVRPTWEGGRFAGGEARRLELIKTCVPYRPTYLDIELKAWINHPALAEYYCSLDARDRPQLILSSHHFDARPADLRQILGAIASHPEAKVAKIAFQSQSLHDALDALDLYEPLMQYPGLQGVFIAMGEHGAITRTLAGKYGAAFTFATLPGGASTAAGQPSVRDLIDLYRLPQQQADWPLYGLVGWPVAQSVSPQMHNTALRALDISGVYVRLPVPGDGEAFQSAIHRLESSPHAVLRGISVTIPHKENAYRYVKAAGGVIRGRDVGAINTILLCNHTPPIGLNTDAPGGLQALLRGAKWTPADLSGKRVAIIGAGGAAAGLSAALAEHGCRLTIYNRSLPRAVQLAKQIELMGTECHSVELSQMKLDTADIIVQCTPVGMYPHTDAMPIPPDTAIRPGTVVMDTIYNPRRTKLLEWATAHGAVCVEGVEMLVGQGALQFKGFTGIDPPINIMRDAAIKALGV